MKIQKIQDLHLDNKTVFLRCDFNVPLDKNGEIVDFKRINSTLKTIEYLLQKNCAIIIASHLGRPNGPEKKLSLSSIQKVLRSLIRWPIILAPGITDEITLSLARDLQPGQVLMLENLRFDAREKGNCDIFTKHLAEMAEFYINDAFGVCHREHSSIHKVPALFPFEKKAGGFLMQKEISYFYDTMNASTGKFVAILWGSKVSSKLMTIKKLLGKVDTLIIWWAMAFSFLKAQGYPTGKSLVENDLIPEARAILNAAKRLWKKVVLPIDVVVSDCFSEDGIIKTVPYNEIPQNMIGLDVGKESIELFRDTCKWADTIFWNGPMWAYELEPFFTWSAGIARILAESPALCFVWWGDSLSVIKKMKVERDIDFLSTWWWASLQLLEWRTLPWIEQLLHTKKDF